jgi:hypothetical protein
MLYYACSPMPQMLIDQIPKNNGNMPPPALLSHFKDMSFLFVWATTAMVFFWIVPMLAQTEYVRPNLMTKMMAPPHHYLWGGVCLSILLIYQVNNRLWRRKWISILLWVAALPVWYWLLEAFLVSQFNINSRPIP